MLFKLIPWWAIFRKLNINCRLFRYLPLTLTERLVLAVVCKSRNLLTKWWTNGMAMPRCTRWPMFVSSTFAVVYPLLMILLMAFIYAINMFSGSTISSWQKFISQPRIVFCSSRGASDWSLFIASMVLWGIGLSLCSGRAQLSKARSGARSHRTKFLSPQSPPLMRWYCQCKPWWYLVGWLGYQQLIWHHQQMGLSHLQILVEGLGVFFQIVLWDPNRHFVWLLQWDHIRTLKLHKILGAGFPTKWQSESHQC